ncbi:amidohydrolase [Anaerotignum lactatifermentans]|uniref:Amidohydrolase n=1 Tax=Anaerotignum lactatifermentans TaxID=160404 RepID=A0ABS2GD67_9FIRM|nr:amidohydrolase [Anaerotignum lactatifermentans]MBM6829931.1 amidohydrolase [Anaerotignum lactatifermentans]MBM6878434.1 amidohydrolase [Anaerotignum lactatifermentans]MBM6951644.1 amidohydrolase [Anaerotignum lactatifermentans]
MNYDFALLTEELRQIRRDLHQIPELGLQEYKTKAYILEKLHSFGITQTEEWLDTGVIALIPGKEEGPAFAFRADMDALTVTEETGCDFASRHPGCMHACGHDGHMTILLGFAKYLAAHRDQLKRDVLLIFQPAEEGPGGAQLLIDAGLFKKHPASCIIGCHIFPQVAEGKIACRKGAMMARNGEVDVHIYGQSAHGAQPHLGSDAVLAAGAVITGLHTILSRNVSPLDSGVLTFGAIQGGEACNIIAKEVKLEGTMRAFSDEAYDTMTRRVQETAAGIAAGYGCKGEAVFRHMYRVVNNDSRLVEALQTIAGQAYEETPPYMLAEDFSLYQQALPGMFFFLGAGNPEKGYTAPLHSASFQFDESILTKGVETYAGLLELLQNSGTF